MKFEITPVKEDPCLKEVAVLLGYKISTLRKRLKPYTIGYKRIGAGNARYVTPQDIEFIKQLMKKTDAYKSMVEQAKQRKL